MLAVLTPLVTPVVLLLNTIQKTTDRATRTGVSSSYSTRDKTLHRKLQIEQHEPVLAVLTPLETTHYTENYIEQHEPVLAVLTPLVTPVVLLLNTTQKTEQHEPVLAVLTPLETTHYTENYR